MSLIEKIKQNLFLIPGERFDGLTKDKGFGESFKYLLAILAISLVVSIIASSVLNPGFIGLFPLLIAGMVIGLVIAIPILYISYGVMHLFLKIVGAKESYLKTVQVFIYGGTCGTLFSGIPLLGYLAGLVSLVNIVLGAARVHKISVLRSIVALVVIPAVIAVVLFVALAGYFMATLSSFQPTY